MGRGERTTKRNLPGHLRQRRINQLLKIHLLILDIKQRLPRPQARLPKPQRPGRLIPIQRLDVQHAQRVRDILRRHGRAFAVAHEFQRFFQDLRDAVFDVSR